MSKNSLWDNILSDSQLEKYGLIPDEVYKNTIFNSSDSFQPVQSFKLLPDNSYEEVDDDQQTTIGGDDDDDVSMKPTTDYAKICKKKKESNLPLFDLNTHKKRFGFNGLDFLTFYLYKNNIYRQQDDDDDRKTVQNLSDIPWIQEEWKKHPRKPLPLSLQWTDEDAAIKLQSYWRGYLVSGFF
ncbi:unnamed protein product [Schistosoma turkestanicum]|nr:unnamed protein product [Schistosoma turkestanicum]